MTAVDDIAAAARAEMPGVDWNEMQKAIGDALQRERRYADALIAYRAVARTAPHTPHLFSQMGLLAMRTGSFQQALALYQRALSRKPNDAETRFGASLAYLINGALKDGWPLYAARSHREHMLPDQLADVVARTPRLETWPPPAGARILLYTDQGLGDQILFASLMPDVIDAATGPLSLAVDNRLIKLFRRSFPGIDVRSQVMGFEECAITPLTGPNAGVTVNRADFDYQIPLADCARWLRPHVRAFRPAAYLTPDAAAAAAASGGYRAYARGRKLIGIAWRSFNTKCDPEKSAPLRHWRPIFAAVDAVFLILQYGPIADEVKAAMAAHQVELLQDPSVDPLRDTDRLAAQIAALDVVVTTSNATAHLAGAIGKRVLLMIPLGFGQQWHWFLGRSTSVWYPNVEIFRQTVPGDWTGPIAAVAKRLKEL